jgi:hypothetical protein
MFRATLEARVHRAFLWNGPASDVADGPRADALCWLSGNFSGCQTIHDGPCSRPGFCLPTAEFNRIHCRRRFMGWKTIAVALLLAIPPNAQAQEESGHISLGGGYANYDLNGVGDTGIFTLRVGAPVASTFGWEVSLSYLKPGEEDAKANLFLPEIQLQLMKAFGRLTPYLGIGAGAAIAASDDIEIGGIEFEGTTETDFAPSGSLGGRVALTESVGLFAEGRLHGIEIDFTGTIAELVGGLNFSF